MKFFSVFLFALLALMAEAKVAFTNTGFIVEPGKPFVLTWAGNNGPVTITLKNGPNTNLRTVFVIASDLPGTSYTWTPPATLPSDTYAFEIKDSSDTNWSMQWTFQGSASASVSGSSALSTGSASRTSTTLSTTVTSSSTGSSSSGSTSSGSASSTATTSGSTTTATTATTAATTTRSTATNTPVNTSGGQRYQSSLALVLGTVVALLYFN